jgi:ribosomal protein L9
MEFCHINSSLHSPAAQRLVEFIQKRREQWAMQADLCNVDRFESFEQDLHMLIMALECELVSEELSRYDLAAQEIAVEGKVYRRGVRLPETYLTAAGQVAVERHLYHPVAEKVDVSVRWNCAAGSSLAISHRVRRGREPLRWRI